MKAQAAELDRKIALTIAKPEEENQENTQEQSQGNKSESPTLQVGNKFSQLPSPSPDTSQHEDRDIKPTGYKPKWR